MTVAIVRDVEEVRDSETAVLDVSIVLPVFNEHGHLHAEIDRIRGALDASPYSYEIIVVDDGSDDGSERAAARSRASASLRHNRTGAPARPAVPAPARRTGRVVVWTDVDMTYPNDLIPELVKELDGYDQVVGARPTEEGTQRVFRVPAKWFIRKLASYLTDTEDPRPQLRAAGLPARRRDAVHPPAARRLLVRHHDHDDVPRQRVLGEVLADRVPGAGRHVEVPLVARHASATCSRSCGCRCRTTRCGCSCRSGWSSLAVGLGKLVLRLGRQGLPLAANTLLILFAAFQVITIGLLADLVRPGRPSPRRRSPPA